MATNPPKGEKRRPRHALGREIFARISEVEGIRLSDEMKEAFAQFDQQGLPPDKRRRAIIARFKRAAKS